MGSKYDKGYESFETSEREVAHNQIIPEQAFGDPNALGIDGPWKNYPSFAAWVESRFEELESIMYLGASTKPNPLRPTERQHNLDGKRAAVEIERLFAAASPLGVSYGAILKESEKRRVSEQATIQLSDKTNQ